ncbi:uncharacterized protein PGTG_14014 [Puccinia graminis f. sp. tritici CRL 75-36-700-3]|uniref:Uncharacterized protein n=1 Tax=Puccinia graminis f. sp. tritici (strain CRL 75-36-700-3 / race SCCL) TaxID=418459 RepID=E3KVW1_PUCGT|nr:uncharacterized protein PGTG_14014 [Puccinia graminis f. sp. tritici CRL 75-36-700-3]EFP88436.1 hypothetical protein PGTG_14014 [Puccinia graminis f. sp. tritici CRL 75-36-700-3]
MACEGSALTVAEQGSIADQDKHDELGSEPESDNNATLRGDYDIEDEDIGLLGSNGKMFSRKDAIDNDAVGSLASNGEVTLGSQDTVENDKNKMESNASIHSGEAEDATDHEEMRSLRSNREVTLGSQDTVETDKDEMESNESICGGEEEGLVGSEGDVTLGSEDTLTTKDKDIEESDEEDQLSAILTTYLNIVSVWLFYNCTSGGAILCLCYDLW